MIKVLVVASGNSGMISPFIQDQINALKKEETEISEFLIKGKGILGYIKNYRLLLKAIKLYKPDIIHAHFGLSGLLSVLQRGIPVVTTFHGCDINVPKNRFLSRIANKLNAKSIFVSNDLSNKLNQNNPIVIPCGIDLDIFYSMEDKDKVKIKMGLDKDKKYILFSSSFSTQVKNYPLAREAVSKIKNKNIELLELKDYDRNEVALLMNAVDLVLLTSFREASPQFIKEAMACNCPIVTTDVGDVRDIIKDTKGCFISKSDSDDISIKIQEALNYNKKTLGRINIKRFDNNFIADNIIDIYKSILIK